MSGADHVTVGRWQNQAPHCSPRGARIGRLELRPCPTLTLGPAQGPPGVGQSRDIVGQSRGIEACRLGAQMGATRWALVRGPPGRRTVLASLQLRAEPPGLAFRSAGTGATGRPTGSRDRRAVLALLQHPPGLPRGGKARQRRRDPELGPPGRAMPGARPQLAPRSGRKMSVGRSRDAVGR